ncbi:metal-dependent hydrolase [Jannaschia sp. CCS1]|uniref:metal-dependent hydrolase n=1 Tax=Jannaschia sp. (strain CCS1) TaxID=290400 RepID=UPI00006C003F|nr:metal-dependent hydrolase [Jannaschia sp. CCS1]ABD55234.1 membrane-bound metal-dependent hydrolase [Jannaschia sp. CCS1]
MITAHLPSGYVLGASLGLTGTAFAAALIGAVFPDLDLLMFYVIDDRAIHHHRYWVHAPAFAACVGGALIVCASLWAPVWRWPAIAFTAAWLLHIVLDSIGGGIMWLWPYSDTLASVIIVPGREGVPWVLAFLTHWSIVFELMIWAVAAAFWIRRRQHD